MVTVTDGREPHEMPVNVATAAAAKQKQTRIMRLLEVMSMSCGCEGILPKDGTIPNGLTPVGSSVPPIDPPTLSITCDPDLPVGLHYLMIRKKADGTCEIVKAAV
jgi:hypothetical protein